MEQTVACCDARTQKHIHLDPRGNSTTPKLPSKLPEILPIASLDLVCALLVLSFWWTEQMIVLTAPIRGKGACRGPGTDWGCSLCIRRHWKERSWAAAIGFAHMGVVGTARWNAVCLRVTSSFQTLAFSCLTRKSPGSRLKGGFVKLPPLARFSWVMFALTDTNTTWKKIHFFTL